MNKTNARHLHEALYDKSIAVLMGGISSEREVSIKSGKGVARALREAGYTIEEIDIGHDAAEVLAEKKPAVAVIILHGKYGEGGQIQGMLEIMGIPYTGSGVLASSLSLDKGMSKRMFELMGVPTARYQVIDVSRDYSVDLPLPLVVKPACEGSTIGLTIARDPETLTKGIGVAARYDDSIVIEEFIDGREFTVGVLGDPPMALPVVEILPTHDHFDFQCKYTKGMTRYDCPAKVDDSIFKDMQKTAVKIHTSFKCHAFSRVDFMTNRKGEIFTLEINTIPGFTETSLLPMAAAVAGYDFESLCEYVLMSAFDRAGLKVGIY